MWPIGWITKPSLLKHVFSILPSHPGVHIKPAWVKVRSGKIVGTETSEKKLPASSSPRKNTTHLPLSRRHFAIGILLDLNTDNIHFFHLMALEPILIFFFFFSWGLKCQHEMFLLNLSVSPHHVVPLGQGISSEKRKPLPHYAANFRHQEKMFAKFWPTFQVLEWYSPLSAPMGYAGWFRYLSELKETICNIYSGTSKVSYRSQASDMNDSIWNSNFLFTVIRGNILSLGK